MAKPTLADVTNGFTIVSIAIGTAATGPAWAVGLTAVVGGAYVLIHKINSGRNTPNRNELQTEVENFLKTLSHLERRDEVKKNTAAREACKNAKQSLEQLQTILKEDLKKADRRGVEDALKELEKSLKRLGIRP